MAAYVASGGPLPASDSGRIHVSGDFRARQGGGPDPFVNPNTGLNIAEDTPFFCKTTTRPPIDAGGGTGGDTWNAVAKIDHSFTPATRLSFRYALTDIKNPLGASAVAASDSPWPGFRSDRTFRSSNYGTTLTHTFSANMVNESRINFMRTDPENPNGTGDPSIPCLQVPNLIGSPDGNPIVFPGYIPNLCQFASLRAGGPQKIRFRAELGLRLRRDGTPSNGALALPRCVITMFSPHLKAERGHSPHRKTWSPANSTEPTYWQSTQKDTCQARCMTLQ